MTDTGGYEAFAVFHALKLHFTSKYDFVKYNGKCNIGKDAFMLRKDKFYFYKLSRKYKKEELFGYYISNILVNPKLWAGDLLNEEAESVYKSWLKWQQSISYNFENDLRNALDSVNKPDELLKVVDGDYPLLYNLYVQRDVNLESIVILNDFMNFLPMWKNKVSDDIIFPDFITKCEKYKPFVNFDKAKMLRIIKKIVMKETA